MMKPARPNSVRAGIESLAARGMSPSRIARELSCSLGFAQHICVQRTAAAAHDSSMPDEEADAFHVARVLVEGGFPAACVIDGQTARLGPFGNPWKHLRRRRAA